MSPAESADVNCLVGSFNEGAQFELGSYVLEKVEIIDFARRFDPQPFHLDDSAALDHPIFKRLSASGWHLSSILGLLVTKQIHAAGLRPLAGLGAQNIRWLSPGYAGDTLTGQAVVTGRRRSRSNPSREVLTIKATLINHDGAVVMEMEASGLLGES